MKILLIVVIILIIFLAIRYIIKSKSDSSLKESEESKYSNKSIEILKKYFGDKNFYQNNDLSDLKSKLDIKIPHKKDLETIIKSALHKIDVHYTFSINSNKPYSDLTTLKLTANEVIDYCIKNQITIKRAIVFILLAINNDSIKEKMDEEYNDEKYLESFYELLPGFVERYNKKLNS